MFPKNARKHDKIVTAKEIKVHDNVPRRERVSPFTDSARSKTDIFQNYRLGKIEK